MTEKAETIQELVSSLYQLPRRLENNLFTIRTFLRASAYTLEKGSECNPAEHLQRLESVLSAYEDLKSTLADRLSSLEEQTRRLLSLVCASQAPHEPPQQDLPIDTPPLGNGLPSQS